MPTAIKKVCGFYGCHNLTNNYYCEEHQKQVAQRRDDQRKEYLENRPSPSKRGYDSRWQKIRKLYLSSHPLCAHCLKSGKIKNAEEVDHILPLNDGGSHRENNLQSLCKSCHSRKTQSDVKMRRDDRR